MPSSLSLPGISTRRRRRRPSLRTQLREALETDYCIIPYRECRLKFREDIWKVRKRDADATPPVSPKTVPLQRVDEEDVEWLALDDDSDSDGNGDKGHGGGGGGGGGEGLRLKQYGEGDGRMVEEMQMPGGSCQTEGSLTTLSRKKRRVTEKKDVGDRAALGTLAGGVSGE